MVTKHIDALESHLGARLVNRNTRRVTPTEAGRNYGHAAERIIAELEAAEALTAADQLSVQGKLRVNGPVSFGVREIAPLMSEFQRANPELVVELGLNDRVVDLVEEGWDMAIRVGRLASSSLIARKLAPCRMVLCGSSTYLAERGVPKRVEDLRRHECLGYTLSRTVGTQTWCFGTAGDIAVAISGHLHASNGDALLAAAINGQGLTYQPTFMLADAIRSGQLRALELDHPPVDMGGIYAVYPSKERLPAKVRVFVDYLTEAFAGIPPWERRQADGKASRRGARRMR